MSPSRGGSCRSGDTQDLSVWSMVYRHVELLARLHRLNDHETEELRQEAYVTITSDGGLAGPEPGDHVAQVVQRILDRWRKTAQRTRDRQRDGPFRPVATKRVVPILCPRFVSVAGRHERPQAYLRALHRAAIRVAHVPGVLRDTQLRPFLLAYDDGVSVQWIADAMGVKPGAIVERLRRASLAVERALVQRVAAELRREECLALGLGDGGPNGRAPENLPPDASPDWQTTCDRLETRLQQLGRLEA